MNQDKRARIDHHQQPHQSPAEVFRLITRSNFLTIQELGRFLLFTSKSMTNSIYDSSEEVWELLFLSRFGPSIFSIPRSSKRSFLVATMKEEARRPPMDIRGLRYSPEQYQVIVNVFQSRGGQAILSKVMKGETVPTFFQHGNIIMKDLKVQIDFDRYMGVSVHVHRLVDDKVICLYDSSDCDQFEEDQLYFYNGDCLEMSDMPYARQLGKDLSTISESIEGISMEIELKTGYERAEENVSCGCGCCIGGGKIYIKELEVLANIKEYDDYNAFPKDSNVTFAHYLEEIYGWGQ